MKFSVATNFEPDLPDALAGYPVAELFGKLPSDRLGGGRASFMLKPLSVRRFREHVTQAASRGIGFNYLLNPACMDNREYTRQGQADLERLLDLVESCGIASVTVSLPFLASIIKRRHPHLTVRVGVYARVDTVAKARFWEDLGVDCITLESISINRDFRMLQAIRSAVSLELQLIANSNCLLHCPLSGHHMVNLSHASQAGHASRGYLIDYCALCCSEMKVRDPSHYLRSEFIRPEDMKHYLDRGFGSFKILERGAPTPVLVERVAAYTRGRYDGNLLDLIQPYGYKTTTNRSMWSLFLKYFFRPASIHPFRLHKIKQLAEKRGLLAAVKGNPVFIDNRKLDGFLEGLMQIDCRSTDCSTCGYCRRWADRAVTVDERFRTDLLALYEDAFDDMHSGRIWGMRPKGGSPC